ncbi:CbtA family protein [Gordonia sp. CPCC 205515]|uniref:CbtA family protein n=1 Tax=Gordonia sp. CPCC 205515 TaxID=3140791 RepID=UPI003AF3E5C8
MERTYIGAGLLSGLAGGVVTFCYARIFVEPQVAAAIEYEETRSHAIEHLTGEHGHEHEVFSRSVQENIGAGIGTVVFAIAMGAVFAVGFTLLWTYLGRRYPRTDPRWVAAAVGLLSFLALYAVPFAVYPANPPAVGDGDTIGARSGAYLTVTLVSVLAMIGAVIATLALRPRIGGLWSALVAACGYLATMVVTAALLPDFDEVPRPLVDPSGAVVAPGFPAEVMAQFRLHAVTAQVLLWVTVVVTFIVVLGRLAGAPSRRPRTVAVAVE